MINVIDDIKLQAHLIPDFTKYNETNVRDNTNCYSHALGLTKPYLTLYRVGAISNNKQITEEYKSIDEIVNLLFLDCKELNLKITKSSLDEKIEENEYKIALFVSIYRNGHIGYHFWRFDGDNWTEKFRTKPMTQIQDFQKEKLDYYPWRFVSIYKIER